MSSTSPAPHPFHCPPPTEVREGLYSGTERPRRQLIDVPPLSTFREAYVHGQALHQTPAARSRGWSVLLRKEVIQPHLPVRLPCYDLVPIASPTFDGSPL